MWLDNRQKQLEKTIEILQKEIYKYRASLVWAFNGANWERERKNKKGLMN